MGIGPRLAVLARFPVFSWTSVFPGRTVLARGAFNARFGVAWWASIGPVTTIAIAIAIATSAIAPHSAATVAAWRLALLLSSAPWRAVFADIRCRALTLASAAATTV